jgi:hypothetical protein
MRAKKNLILSILVIILGGCSPTTHKSFVKRSDAVYLSMIKVLKQVEHPQDFHLLSSLKPLYVELAELIVLSIKYEEKDPQIFNLEIIEASHQEELKQHLIRIYNLEGGRNAIEQVAREGFIVLQKSPYKLKKSRP